MPSNGWLFTVCHGELSGVESTPVPAPSSSSVVARWWGILVAPGRVFDACARTPVRWSNWVATSILISVVSVAVQWVMFSNPAFLEAMRAQSEQVLQQRVASGAATAEEAERARKMLSEAEGLSAMRVAVAVLSAAGAWLVPFWWGGFLWVVGSWVFRADLSYARGVEIAALAAVVSALGLVVRLGLILATGQVHAGLNLGMLVPDFSPANRWHGILAAVDLFGLWHLLVMTLGLSRVIGRPLKPVLVVLGGVWLGFKDFSVVSGLGQRSV